VFTRALFATVGAEDDLRAGVVEHRAASPFDREARLAHGV